ncbi:Fur family transcriptional regulator [Boseongicola aestuarii]|uniref:Zinc uptake regulation protein n=1 Tax=Boseongicola aestuarii TaxID=1470561 RepID=A0A238IY91_9RHOB|nr:transcriptional repressor [Boseongicola aestuarii]SMX23459.1 Zinc uptake regulation protein [Boseongicola aestuarii]
MAPLGFELHDHSSCIASAVARADAACRSAGLQFTPVRRRVLEILLSDHRARGAYEILDILRDEGLGSQPPVAYRALEFLVAHGFAHRIEKLNAFIACGYSENAHTPAFLICRNCDAVAETDAAPKKSAVGRTAKAAGFQIEHAVVEIEGLCPKCQAGES